MEGLESRVLMTAELYFAANNGTSGSELFSYNGTTATLRANINPGSASSNPAGLTSYNGLLYFTADDGSTGTELWRFDGTSATRAADINVGPIGSAPEGLTVYNNKLYFSANNGPAGYELMVYDAATGVASVAANINNTSSGASSDPQDLTVYNGKLYFTATDGVHGRELWSYDSTTGSSGMVADIRSGSSSSSIHSMAVYSGALYFGANDGATGTELWRFNGTNTEQVADIFAGATGSAVSDLVLYNGKLYFVASGSDGIGREIWRYDTTTAERVTDVYYLPAGIEGGDSNPNNLVVYNDRLYFTASDSGETGIELYAYNSASSTTVQIQDFTPGFNSSTFTGFAAYNGKLYFGGDNNGGTGIELYRYDSAAPPIQLAANINTAAGSGSSPNNFVVYGPASPPTVSTIAEQVMSPGTTLGPINFTVGDDGPLSALTVTVSSSNPTLFPQSGLSLSGSGANRSLSITPAAGQLGSATISVSVSDGEFVSGSSFVVTVTNTPNNHAPVLDASGDPVFPSITEDSTTHTGMSVNSLISALGGSKFTDVDAGALRGIAVTGADNSNGQWQYSTDSGATWSNLGAVSTANATLLSDAPAMRVRFLPAANFNGTLNPGITFRAWDQTFGSVGDSVNVFPNGGRTAFSTQAETASITVTPVNDAPVAGNDVVRTDRLIPVTFDPRANDTDVDSPAPFVNRVNGAAIALGATIALPSGAKLTLNTNQTFTYNPNGVYNSLKPNEVAQDTFTYNITDDQSLESQGLVTVRATNRTIYVDTTAGDDDGETTIDTSLREAINLAQSLPGHENIVLSPGTYTLNEALPSTFGAIGLPEIDTSLSIVGHGAIIERSSAVNTPAFRLLAVDPGARLWLEGVTLRNGLAQGGDGGVGIFGGGGGAGLGGAIFNAGELRILNSTLVSNSAVGGRGGDGNNGRFGGGGGGGIGAGGGSATSVGGAGGGGNVTAGSNGGSFGGTGGGNIGSGAGSGGNSNGGFGIVGGGGGGGGSSSSGGGVGGGGILGGGGGGGGAAQNGNTSNGNGGDGGFGAGGGGAGRNINFALSGGFGGDGGFGGGAGGGQPTSSGSGAFLDTGYGTPGFGGGTAPHFQGGDVYAGGGGAGMGGGIFNFDGSVTLLNTTFSANVATGGRGGTTPGFNGTQSGQGAAYGAGVFTRNGSLTIVNSTFSANVANQNVGFGFPERLAGGAVYALGDGTGQSAQVIVHNTILANSNNPNPGVYVALSDYAASTNNGGTVTAVGQENIIESASGTAPAAQAVDPLLGPLANNGGDVFTYALLSGSPAIEAGNNSRASDFGLTTDARGFGYGRIQDNGDSNIQRTVDIGAFELNPDIGPIGDVTLSEDSNINVGFDLGDSVSGFQSVTVSSNNPNVIPNNVANLKVTGVAGHRVVNITPAADRYGNAVITLTVTDFNGNSASRSFVVTVTSANDAPVLNNSGSPFLDSYVEDTLRPGGERVRDLINSAQPVTLITDVDEKAEQGIAVTAVDTSKGKLEFTIDSGKTWAPVETSSGKARLLASDSDTFIRFIPNSNFAGTITQLLTFRAWDQTSGVNGQSVPIDVTGGTSAFSTAIETASLTVTPVNDGAPTLNNGGSPYLTSIAEDDVNNAGTTIGTLLNSAGNANIITDPDAENPRGIAITGVDSSIGKWQFSTDSGTNWSTLLLSTGVARLLGDYPSNRIRLVPNPNYNGTSTSAITFRAWDGSSGTDGSLATIPATGGTTAFSTATETASITVTAVNDLPTPVEDNIADSAEDTQRTILGSTLVANDSAGPADESGQSLIPLAIGDVIGGVVIVQGADVLFIPNSNYVGPAGFTYIVQDNGSPVAMSATAATVRFNITAANDAPQFTPGASPVVNEDAGSQTIANWATNIGPGPANATDEANQTVSFSASIVQISSTLSFTTPPSIAADGTLKFTPAPDAFGQATVFVTLTDSGPTGGSNVNSATSSFTITVNAVNDRPTAANDALSDSNEDTPRLIPSSTLLSNDSAGPANESDQAVRITRLSSAFGGTAAFNSNGDVIFTPAANYVGAAGFSYTISDNGSPALPGAGAAAVSFNILPLNDAPQFTPGASPVVNEDAGPQAIIGWATNILPGPATATDEASQTLGFVVTTDTRSPTLSFTAEPTIDPQGNLRFTAAPNAYGTATFIATLTDNGPTGAPNVNFTSRTFSITVNPVNDAPTAADDVLADSNEDVYRVIPASQLLANDSAGAGNEGDQTLSIASVGNAVGGTVFLLDGDVGFIPAADFNGLASFTYFVQDNGSPVAASATAATVSFNILSINDAPYYTQGDSPVADEDAGPQSFAWATDIRPGPVTAVDEAKQGLSWQLTPTSQSSTLSFTAGPAIDLQGNVTFTSAPNAYGTLQVSATLKDDGPSGGFNRSRTTRAFTITVNPVNDAPTLATPLTDRAVGAGSPLQFVVPADAFTDVDGDALAYSATLANDSALPAWLSFDPSNRTFSGTPAAPDAGAFTVRYTANDGTTSTSDDFNITVAAPPVVTAPAPQNTIPGVNANFNLGSFTDADPLAGPWNVSVDWGDGSTLTSFQVGQNLLQSSSALHQSSWSKSSASVAPNAAAAPDGTFTADKLIASAANGQHVVHQGVSKLAQSQQYAFSIFLKAGEYDTATLYLGDEANHYASADVNLSAQTVTLHVYGGGMVANAGTVTPAGDGWYQVTLLATTTATSRLHAYVFPKGNASFAGNDSSGIYAWGATLAQSAQSPISLGTKSHVYGAMGSFTPQVTVTNSHGGVDRANFTVSAHSSQPVFTPAGDQTRVAGIPVTIDLGSFRDEYALAGPWDVSVDWGDGSAPSAFQLGQNNVQSPTKLDESKWIKSAVAVTPDVIAAPDGSMTADKVVATGGAGQHTLHQGFNKSASSQRYTFSLYLKAAEFDSATIYLGDEANHYASATINLTALTATPRVYGGGMVAESATVTPVGNGWYLASLTATTTATGRLHAYLFPNSNASFAGDNSKGIYAWGLSVRQTAETSVSLGSRSHVFDRPGDYDVKVRVTNQFASDGDGIFKVSVQPSTPQVTTPADQAAQAGIPASFDLGSFVDASAAAGPWNISVDWGDGSAPTTVQFGQNQLQASYTLDQSPWVKSQVLVTPDFAIAPDGTATAEKLIASASNGQHVLHQGISKDASSQRYTLSLYLKAAEYDTATIYLGDEASHYASADVNLSTQTASLRVYGGGMAAESGTVAAVGNGWYHVTLTATTTTTPRLHAYVFPKTNGSFNGDDSSGILVWGVTLGQSAQTSTSLGSVAHTYADGGIYSATVSVTNALGVTGGGVFGVNVASSSSLVALEESALRPAYVPAGSQFEGVRETLKRDRRGVFSEQLI